MTFARTNVRRLAVAAGLTASLAVTACSDDEGLTATAGTAVEEPADSAVVEPVIDPGDGGDYDPQLDPADFVDVIDNPYLPYPTGASWVYEGESDGETERIEITVQPERRVVMGISAVVVRDTVTIDGELFEDTLDWFAQDRDGNVWYLGEESKEYENGEVTSTEGSWEAGVDGALPGIVMQAHPEVGQAYRQEFYVGEAEDLGEVVRTGVSRTVPFGSLDQLVVIQEWNPFEPETIEEKYYAPGVGLVFEEKVAGGEGNVELLEYVTGP